VPAFLVCWLVGQSRAGSRWNECIVARRVLLLIESCLAVHSRLPPARGETLPAKGHRQLPNDKAKRPGWTIERPRAMYFLNQANHAVRNRLESALASLQMTGIQYTVLSVIGSREGLSSAELSRRFFVTPQTMNELIAGLQHRGLILRKEDPANRRILRMRLTAKGLKMVAACDVLADQVETEVFSFMRPQDYLRLRELTRLIARELRLRDEAGKAEPNLQQ
jgi:DNA-binding MarR family transcriptional regulator